MNAWKGFLPIAPLFVFGLWLVWLGGENHEAPSSQPSVASPQEASATQGGKAGGKNQSKVDVPQQSRVEYRLPSAVASALQSISTRATQDLWGQQAFTTDEASVEQLAQRRANSLARLSKRLAGDMRAKEELGTSLGAWLTMISQHLLGLVGRVRAIGNKLDEDIVAVVGELQEVLVHQPSTASSEKVAAATSALGAVWHGAQEAEIQRIAVALKAFAAVGTPTTMPSHLAHAGGGQSSSGQPQAPAPFHMGEILAGPTAVLPSAREGSEVSFGGAFQDVNMAPHPGSDTVEPAHRQVTRWRKRGSGTADDAELVPDPGAVQEAWCRAWLAVLAMVADSGSDVVGELSVCTEQDAALPGVVDDQAVEQVVQAADGAWDMLLHVVAGPSLQLLEDLHLRLQDVLHRLRSCTGALSKVRQGVLVAAHAATGSIYDPFSYAPGTWQEWLHPSLVVEQDSVPDFMSLPTKCGESYRPLNLRHWLKRFFQWGAPRSAYLHACRDALTHVTACPADGDSVGSAWADLTWAVVWAQTFVATLLAAWQYFVGYRMVDCGWGLVFYPQVLLALSWALHQWHRAYELVLTSAWVICLKVAVFRMPSVVCGAGGPSAGLKIQGARYRAKVRPCRSSGPRLKVTILLLYLSVADGATLHLGAAVVSSWCLRFPTAVQLHAHGFHEGLPVLSTGPVLPTPTAEEMCEVYPVGRTGNLLLPRTDRSRRHIAVFVGTPPGAPILEPCPVPFLVDEWLHGPLLHARLAATLGFPAGVFSASAIRGVLPGLPSEQLLLTPATCSWRQVWLPVDLRPLGGRLCMLMCPRDSTCRAIAVLALAAQTMQTEVDLLLAKCSWGWLTLMSQPLFLQDVDTLQFQIGPAADVLQGPVGSSLDPPLSLFSAMQVSLPTAPSAHEAFPGHSHNQAVLITPNGLVYVEAPVFADAATFRRIVSTRASSSASGGFSAFGIRFLHCLLCSSWRYTVLVMRCPASLTSGPLAGG
ncbi:unnamed protein product [Symbiodinium sp. CCMP2592]|nr:unnamed protein product [Symbiodinium sp. CCMP2592]